MIVRTKTTLWTNKINDKLCVRDITLERFGTYDGVELVVPRSSHRDAKPVKIELSLIELERAIVALRRVG